MFKPKKDKRIFLFYPVVILSVLLILIQILISFNKSFSNWYEPISSTLLFIVAPISFFIFTIIMLKEPKSKHLAKNQILLFIFGIIATFVLSITAAIVAGQFTTLAKNPIINSTKLSDWKVFLKMAWQLFGEEAIKLSFFVIIYREFKYNRNKKIYFWFTWIIIAILFGLLHLSTYKYNLIHILIAISIPNILYGYLYKKSENPLLLWGVHYAFDIIIILFSILQKKL